MWVDSGSGVNAWLGVVRDDESYPNWYLEDGGYHSTGGEIFTFTYTSDSTSQLQ